MPPNARMVESYAEEEVYGDADDLAMGDVERDEAEAAIAERFPVLFALWDTIEDGRISPGHLAMQLGMPPARLRLLVAVAGWLIEHEEIFSLGLGP